MQSQPITSVSVFQNTACALVLSIQYNFCWFSALNVTIKGGSYVRILVMTEWYVKWVLYYFSKLLSIQDRIDNMRRDKMCLQVH